jgi:hypothetical protein
MTASHTMPDEQSRREDGQRGGNELATQASQATRRVRPAWKGVPGVADGVEISVFKGEEALFAHHRLDLPAMHIVDVEVRPERVVPRGHLPKRPCAVGIGDRRPVGLDAASLSDLGQLRRNTGMPVKDRSAGVERKGFDSGH